MTGFGTSCIHNFPCIHFLPVSSYISGGILILILFFNTQMHGLVLYIDFVIIIIIIIIIMVLMMNVFHLQ